MDKNISYYDENAISYFYNDVYYYGCRRENVIKSGLYSEVAKDGYELELEDYIITYDYYERTKYDELIKSIEKVGKIYDRYNKTIVKN